MATKIVMMLFGLTLVLAVACGTAEAPDPTAAPAAEPTTSVGGETSQPTATPQAVAPPADVEIHPGPLTWMVAGWGTERFDSVLAGAGGINQYVRLMHGFPIAANEKGEMIPGIATDWTLSPDGLTWIVNFRDGVNFHDGSPLTAEDVLWTWKH